MLWQWFLAGLFVATKRQQSTITSSLDSPYCVSLKSTKVIFINKGINRSWESTSVALDLILHPLDPSYFYLHPYTIPI